MCSGFWKSICFSDRTSGPCLLAKVSFGLKKPETRPARPRIRWPGNGQNAAPRHRAVTLHLRRAIVGGGRPGVADTDDSVGYFALLAVAGGLFLAFSNFGWTNSIWFGIKYGVAFDDVRTDTKPSDCDFMRAPLGYKGCSYKTEVRVFNADGVLVAGDNAPTYGSDAKTGSPVVSYDGGKNWEWYRGATVPSRKPKSVNVIWVKE